MTPTHQRFRDLAIGQSFEWIEPGGYYNSFYLSCVKTSARGYRDSMGTDHRVGSINAHVYHVTDTPKG